jgi:hypothetical protein
MLLKLCISAGLAFLTALSPAPPAPQRAVLGRRAGTTIRAAAALEWSAPITLSRTAFNSTAPTISLDAKGDAFVAWTEWTGAGWGRNMMFATNAGGAWTPATVVAPLAYDAIDDVGFPTVAATPSGTAWVAYHDGDFAASHMVIMGARYANGVLGPVGNISGSPGASSYVALGVSPVDESLHEVWMDDSLYMFDLALRYRDGQTQAWSAPENALFLPNASKYTYQVNHIAFDPKGTAHLVFQTRYYKAQVWYTRNPTPKNNNTWSEPFNVAPDTLLSDVLPRVQADADGDAYVVWHAIVDGNEEVLLRRTVNGAWQPTENISNSAAASEKPSIAVNPLTKEIFIVWQEQVNSSNWDIFMNSYAIQAGATKPAWSGPVNLTKSAGRSLDPNIAVLPDGSLSLIYSEEIPGGGGRSAILFASKAGIPAKPELLAPLDPGLKTSINRVLFYSKKNNQITFARNAGNDDSLLQEYRIYRRKAEEGDDQFVLLAALNLATFTYKDADLVTKQKYAYLVSVVDKDGREKFSDAVIER